MSERSDNMIESLREWQKIERESMSATARISEQTNSSLIRLIMDIIRHDSHMHHRVQQYLVDSLTVQSPTVSREDIAAIWDSIEAHDRAEKRTIEIAEHLQKEAWTPVHKLLLDYLIRDERKHDQLLEQLDAFKADMSRASGA